MLEKIFAVEFVSVTVTLILLMDGPGNIPIFLAVLKELPPKRQTIVIARELIFALLIMVFFAFCGHYILNHLGIQTQSIQIAGGIILFIIALKMIFSSYSESTYTPRGEPLIVPLAVPMVAGPAVLAAIMVFSKDPDTKDLLLYSIISAWFVTTLVLFFQHLSAGCWAKKGSWLWKNLWGSF
jgi:small neutral amino acid transporter SnatA (MarC family)